MSSKLDKSAIVAGAGLVASIFTMLVKKVREAGGTDEDIHRLSTPEGEKILVEIAKVIVGEERQTFRVMLDYGKNLVEMISAGRYCWVNSDITQEHFPIEGSGQQEVELFLFHFNKVMTSEQVVSEIDKAGYRSAKTEELLALGAMRPELQEKFPIVGFGSVWQSLSGDRHVPCLSWDDGERNLDLGWFEDGWYEDCRFAAVRK